MHCHGLRADDARQVRVLPPDADGARACRRQPRCLTGLYRPFPPALAGTRTAISTSPLCRALAISPIARRRTAPPPSPSFSPPAHGHGTRSDVTREAVEHPPHRGNVAPIGERVGRHHAGHGQCQQRRCNPMGSHRDGCPSCSSVCWLPSKIGLVITMTPTRNIGIASRPM